MEQQDEIVIATDTHEKALYLVAKIAIKKDTIKIRYTDKYTPTVEYLLIILRKAFGWTEKERGEEDVTNNRCEHNQQGMCANKKDLRCKEKTRKTCTDYKQRYTNTFKVNTVTIEKSGSIRGM